MKGFVAFVIALFAVIFIAASAEAGCLGLFSGNGLFGGRQARMENRQARRSGYSYGNSYQGGYSYGNCNGAACAVPQAAVYQHQHYQIVPVAPNPPQPEKPLQGVYGPGTVRPLNQEPPNAPPNGSPR